MITLSANATVAAHFGFRVDVAGVTQFGGAITITSNLPALNCSSGVGGMGCSKFTFVAPNTTVNVTLTEGGEAAGCAWSGFPGWTRNGTFDSLGASDSVVVTQPTALETDPLENGFNCLAIF